MQLTMTDCVGYSHVAREARVCNEGVGHDMNQDAGVIIPSSIVANSCGGDESLHEGRSGFGIAGLRDPLDMLNGLLSCGVGVKKASVIVSDYYQAARVAGTGTGSQLSLVESQGSNKQQRLQRWRAEVSALPDAHGRCYLKVVRWARRKFYLNKLGDDPLMRDFVALLEPGDLDMNEANRLSLYRLPDAVGSSIVYHVADECAVGTRVGSVAASVACLLRCYPWVNCREGVVPMDDYSVDAMAYVGTVGALVEFDGGTGSVPSNFSSSEPSVSVRTVDEDGAFCAPSDLSANPPLGRCALPGCFVGVAEVALDDRARLLKHVVTRDSHAVVGVDHDVAVARAREMVVQASDVAGAVVLKLRELSAASLSDVVPCDQAISVFLPGRSLSVFTPGSVVYTVGGRLHVGLDTYVAVETDTVVWWTPPVESNGVLYVLCADVGSSYYLHSMFARCCAASACYTTGYTDYGDLTSFCVTPGVHRFDRGDTFNMSVSSAVVSSVRSVGGAIRIGSFEVAPNVKLGVHSYVVSTVLVTVVSDCTDVDVRGSAVPG